MIDLKKWKDRNTKLVGMNSSLLKTPADNDSLVLNNLKEFYLYLKSFNNTNENAQSTDSKLDLCSHMQSVLDGLVQCKEKPAKSQRYDIAVSIVDLIMVNETLLDKDPKLPSFIGSKLNQVYFEQLVKAFSINPINSLKAAKFLIKALKNVLHHNLSIINPLLQVIECGFKHSNSEVKSTTYECWTSLILNFALDREFFFKTKKFNLIITPLISKCKAYKDEAICKAKALSWLCLIENINELMPIYMDRVLMPFLEFCFGYNEKKQEKFDHSYESLFQIGYEVFTAIMFNGNLSELPVDLISKFKYVNSDRYYKIKESLNDKSSWLTILKYFFHVIIKKSMPSVMDVKLTLEIWKKMSELLSQSSELENENESQVKKQCLAEAEADAYHNNNLNELNSLFLTNTCELILSNSNNNNKQENNRFISELAWNFCHQISLRSKSNENKKLENTCIKDFGIVFKKCINLLLMAEEDNETTYLNSMNTLLIIIESEPNIHNWVLLTSKYYEHLKCLKNRTGLVQLDQCKTEIINRCLLFPFRNFNRLETSEADLNSINNSISNVVKAFTGLVKSNRFQTSDENVSGPSEFLNLNDWCFRLLDYFNSSHLIPVLTQSVQLNKHVIAEHGGLDYMLKLIQVYAQFVLYILKNVIEFEAINQQQSLITESKSFGETSPVTHGNEIIERLHSSTRKLDTFYSCFTGLVKIIQNLILTFQYLIQFNGTNIDKEQKQLNAVSTSATAGATSGNDTDSKLSIQIFCSLIELMSILFTRVKSHQISNRFLIDFAGCIESVSELNAIGKQAAAQQSNGICMSEQSPASNTQSKRTSRLSLSSSSSTTNSNRTVSGLDISFQSNRHSNDMFDKFSMQIASFIQNHLNKSYSNHQFDTCLLLKLEPIFFSFLKMSKLSLKQKSIQAWNATFGKSTAESLNYTQRLEMLFSDLKDEMTKSSSSSQNTSIPWISLPYFRNIQSTNLTNSFISELDDYMLNEEKENKPKSTFAQPNTPNATDQMSISGSNNNSSGRKKKEITHCMDAELKLSLMKELLNESSSSSVPVAMLVNSNNNKTTANFKTPDRTSWVQNETAKSDTEPMSSGPKKCRKSLPSTNAITNTSSNFVFSPAGQNSFQIAPNTNQIVASCPTHVGLSSSTSKLSNNIMRTPDSSNVISRSSPRSLKHNSKRKLDLNELIDQMPDQDFVEISSPLSENMRTTASSKRSSKNIDSNSKNAIASPKQPLTEHQKEMRRKKSFIPIEMQSVSNVLEATMDSQMSCATTQDAYEFSMPPQTHCQLNFEQSSVNKTSKTLIDFNQKQAVAKLDEIDDEKMNESISPMETSGCADQSREASSDLQSKCQTIKFQSKINPKKQIELFEVKHSSLPQSQAPTNISDAGPASITNTGGSQSNEQNQTDQNSVDMPLSQQNESKIIEKTTNNKPQLDDTCSTPNRRRSARLKSKEVTSEETLFEKINEECKIEKENKTKDLKLNIKNLKRNKFNKKPNLMQINHNLGGGKIMKKTFKDKQNEIKKRLKYRRLIKKLKTNSSTISKPSKVDSLSLDEALIDKEKKIEIEIEIEIKPKEEFETKEIKKIETSDDEDIPLAKLAKKSSAVSAQTQVASTPVSTLDSQTVNNPELAPVIPVPVDGCKKLTQLENPFTNISSPISTPSLAKSTASFSEIAAATSESTAVLIQKLNSTPTTSILKKKAQQDHRLNSPANGKGINLSASFAMTTTTTTTTESNLTPNKRRVSFCESIQIEEIEPNANKSLFRTTPKMPNRAKLVLFNNVNNNCMLNRHVSSPLASSSSSSTLAGNSLLNSPANTAQLNSSTAETKTNNTSLSTNTSCSSPTVQSAKFNSSTATSFSNSLNSIANQLKINSSRLSTCESNNLVPTCSNPVNTAQMSPSSSLISFFSINKQSFMSQRSIIIQQQKLQLNSHSKSDTAASTTAPNSISPTKTLNFKNSPTKKIDLNESASEFSIKPQIETKPKNLELLGTTSLEIIYSKLKNCKTSIERLTNNAFFQTWLENDATKQFKSKNISKIWDLCLLETSQIETLPFREPKSENFIKFMDKFEELNEKKKMRMSKKTEHASLMGSVEEEMSKLEESNCLDTSIECENFKETKEDEVSIRTAETIKQTFSEENQNANELKLSFNNETKENLSTQKTEIENSFNSKVDELAMEIDLDKSMNTEKNQKEVQKVEKLKDETEEGVRIYKDFILGNDETFNIPSNLSSDEYKKLIEKIEEIEHAIASKSFQAKRQIRALEKISSQK